MKTHLFTQIGPVQGVAVDPAIRKDFDATCRSLKIEKKILPVKEFRDEIKMVREKTSDGTIILVTEGGRVKEAADTTVVLSLETLQEALTRAIKCGIATAAKRRSRPADFLTGLPKVPKSAARMDWELDLGTDFASEGSDLET